MKLKRKIMAFTQHKWGYRARKKSKLAAPTREDISLALKEYLNQGGEIQKIQAIDNIQSSTEAFPELTGDYAHILEEDNNLIEEIY